METIVLLSHKSPDSVINVKVEFGKGKGKVPLVEDVCSRTVSEAELSHLLDYLLDLACDEKILELYKRVCRSIYIYIYPGCIKSYIDAYWKMWEEEDSYSADFS